MSMKPVGHAEIRSLLRELARQRRALRRGDTAGLDTATERLTEICDRFDRHGPSRDGRMAELAEELRQEAGMALRETGAALAGLRDAQSLLSRATAVPTGATYGPQGQRRNLNDHPGRLERRT